MEFQTGSDNSTIGNYRIPQDLPLENPFWTFSLSLWKNQQAQSALLSLQDDAGLVVNRLLFCSWLGFERRELDVEMLFRDTKLALWHEHTLNPLRSIRKQLKTTAPFHPQLRATVQNAELQAEQIEQALLFQQTDQLSRPTTKQNTLATLSFNLLSYTHKELEGANQRLPTVSIYPHLITLIQAAIPNHDRSHIEAYFS